MAVTFELKEKIEDTRHRMVASAATCGMNSLETLALSQELDYYIAAYQSNYQKTKS
ncbi:aspartyl-phosphate phosphatase Spo0E family protein [Peribacillus kribbensis]|uniref:aspartyl-phosphate phosphatase Spo0E family protein n=1 Tax=Peribacillus kribbensis TaxID=356658 RepID=UPI00041D08B2|nr:aspartyl-phosphate phosphatase Spo0E family protein [Peribacillus kribbensis]